MTYKLVGPHRVFLSSARFKALSDEAGKGKGPLWPVACWIEGTRESVERSELMQSILARELARDASAFAQDWLRFDLGVDQAPVNVWDLLWDWCQISGYASLADVRDGTEQMLANFSGSSFDYPMGTVFRLNHFVPNRTFWNRVSGSKKGRMISVIIDSAQVRRLSGTLDHFIVQTTGFTLVCGKDFQILPAVGSE